MTVPDVHVRRHVVTCTVVGDRAGADRFVRSAVAGPLASRLDEAFARAAPEGYWVIRRLDFSAQVATGWTSDEVATQLAEELMRELARRTRARSDPEALWFPDRAAFLAQFLVDRARGRDGGRWEYASLGSMSVLALAETEPDDLVAAFLRLGPDELMRTAESLSADEEQSLLRLVQGPGVPGGIMPAIRSLKPARLASTLRPAFVLAFTAAAQGAPLAGVAGPALEVGALLSAARRIDGDDLLGHLAAGRWAEVARIVEPDLFLPFVQWDAADRDALARELRTTRGADADRLHTPFGGCFVLLRLLPDLWNWTAATESWPALDEIPADRVARLLTVTAALGRGLSAASAEDPVVGLALGCDAGLDELAEYVAGLTPAQVASFEAVAADRLWETAEQDLLLAPPFAPSTAADLFARAGRSAVATLGRSLAGMAGSSAPYLWENVLDVPAWLTVEDDRALVEIGNPPLGVLLSIAGLNSGELDVPGEVPWTLTTRS